MKSCGLSIKPPAPRGGLPLPLGPSEDEDADEKKPAPPPPPARDCSVVLVHDGGRATFDDCKFSGSPLSYGVVTRGQGTRVRKTDMGQNTQLGQACAWRCNL